MRTSLPLRLSLATAGVLLLGGCSLFVSKAPEPTPVVPAPVIPASVTVSAQDVVDNVVTVASVVSKGPGWMTIHADLNDAPAAVIGYTPVVNGENLNVKVTIDPTKATAKMYAMLHIDSGILGTYEFPGADVPAKDDAGLMISPSFLMTNASTTTTTATSTDKNVAMKAETRTFTVTADNFSYDLKEIKVSQGETVVIKFKNSEGFHDWVVDEFKARTKQIGEGQSETITFLADKKGTFEYYCSVGKHRQMGMKGNLIVQ